MLRINYTERDIDNVLSEMDESFESFEDIMADALEIIDEYESKIEFTRK